MKNKIITFLAVLISLIFVGSVFYFTYNLYAEYSHGDERTKRQYEHLVNTIKDTEDMGLIQTAVGNLNNYNYLEIKKDGKQIYIFGDNNAASAQSNSKTKLINDYKSDFISSYGSRIQINGGLYKLKPGTIFSKARISFIVILVTTAFTVLLIIYIYLVEKEKFTADDSDEDLEDEKDIDNIDDTDDDSDDNSDGSIKFKNDDEDSKSNIAADDSKTDSSDVADGAKTDETSPSNEDNKNIAEASDNIEKNSENKSAGENSTEETAADKISENQMTANETSSELKENKPEKLPEDESKPAQMQADSNLENTENTEPSKLELYSETSGVGLEKNLESRVETELSRAIAAENDLTLFIIRIPDLDRSSILCREIAEKLTESFMYKDLIFEFGQDSFAALKLNINLDEGIEFSEEVNHNIASLLSKENKNCYIGLSSRSQRMVAAKRLITEASEALVHAQQDPDTPITAFRVNTEKYMRLIGQ